MSHDSRRRVIFLLAALVVVALVMASVGCSTTTGGGDGDGDEEPGDGPELTGAVYTTSMNDICTETTERLGDLPTPPDEISRADWADEVSLALRDEAAAFDAIRVGESRRDDHASFVENTEDQAAQWSALSAELARIGAESTEIADITNEIAELTLGRNDLADQMALTGCRARELS
jgi:hypothetical protein